jgi:hypothetical protein
MRREMSGTLLVIAKGGVGAVSSSEVQQELGFGISVGRGRLAPK